MSRLLLDTTFLIDAERSGDWLDREIDDDDEVAIAAVTVAELQVGALLARGRARAARATFVDEVVSTIEIVHYDVNVALSHASLLVHVRREGRPRGAHDLIIAATAAATGRSVLTAAAHGFADRPGVSVRAH